MKEGNLSEFCNVEFTFVNRIPNSKGPKAKGFLTFFNLVKVFFNVWPHKNDDDAFNVAWPTQSYNSKDGQTKYQSLVEFVNEDERNEVNKMIIDAYFVELNKQPVVEKPTEPVKSTSSKYPTKAKPASEDIVDETSGKVSDRLAMLRNRVSTSS